MGTSPSSVKQYLRPLSEYAPCGKRLGLLRLGLMAMAAGVLRRDVRALGHAGGLDVVLCRLGRAEPFFSELAHHNKKERLGVHGALAEMAVGNGCDLGPRGGGFLGSLGGFGDGGGVLGVYDLNFAVAGRFETISKNGDLDKVGFGERERGMLTSWLRGNGSQCTTTVVPSSQSPSHRQRLETLSRHSYNTYKQSTP